MMSRHGILRPPWDDRSSVIGRRRSSSWRRLLAGAAGLTRLSPGATCGCGVAPTSCADCDWLGNYPTLYITDSFTTVPCDGISGSGGWIGCYRMTGLSPSTNGCFCEYGDGPYSTSCSGIYYRIACEECPDDATILCITVTRYWTACFTNLGGISCGYCCPDGWSRVGANCVATYAPCIPPNEFLPQCTLTGPDQGEFLFTSCTPFPKSLSLTLSNITCFDSSILPSPLGPGITINP